MSYFPALALLGLFVLAGVARANGRFPAAQQLLIDPARQNSLILRSTFGARVSKDGGESWHYLYE